MAPLKKSSNPEMSVELRPISSEKLTDKHEQVNERIGIDILRFEIRAIQRVRFSQLSPVFGA